jgi:hypothetical protein
MIYPILGFVVLAVVYQESLVPWKGLVDYVLTLISLDMTELICTMT